MRSRLTGIRATLSQLKTERSKAPAKLDAANKRLAEARDDISTIEAKLGDISEKLTGIDFDEIAQRERRRNELRGELNAMNQRIGAMENHIRASQATKETKERELKKLAENDDDTRIFAARNSLCQELKGRLEAELGEEEEEARNMLRRQISKVLQVTTRKNLRMKLSDGYNVSLVNEEGTQMAKSTGENQLLGLVFTAALVEFARLRQNADDHRLLRGTVAPLVLDSPFGDLDEGYKQTTGEYLPKMASQVVVLVSSSQAQGSAVAALKDRVGKEYVLIRTNRSSGAGKAGETRQLGGRDYAVALFDQPADGTTITEVA